MSHSYWRFLKPLLSSLVFVVLLQAICISCRIITGLRKLKQTQDTGVCEETKERELEAQAPLDDPGGHQSLLGVQVGRGLVDQVDVGRFAQTQREGDSLQLTTRQVLHLQAQTGGRTVVNRQQRFPVERRPCASRTSWSMMLSICMGFMTSVMNCGWV